MAKREKQGSDGSQKYLDIAWVIFVGLNDKGDVTLINRKGCEILEYEEEEIIGKNWFEHFLPARMKGDVKAVFDQLMAGEIEPVEYFENPVVTRSGEERILSWHNTVLNDDEGKIIGTLSSGENISGRRQVEEQFETIFNMSLDMICIADINTATFIKVNPAFTDILGHSEEELLGRPFLDFIHPDDIKPTVDVVEQDLKKGRMVHRFENRYRTQRGEYRWIKWTSHPVPEEGITFAIGRDITEAKQAEEELTRVAKEWQTTFDALNDAVWILDKEHLVLRSNKAAERLFQQPAEALVGKRCYELVHATKEPIPNCPYLRVKKYLKRETMELKVGELWVQIIVDPILDAENRYAGAVHIVTDITERKKADEVLQESEYNLKEAQRITHLGSWSWNQETDEVACSDEMLRIWGYNPGKGSLTLQEVMGRIHPEDRDRVRQALV